MTGPGPGPMPRICRDSIQSPPTRVWFAFPMSTAVQERVVAPMTIGKLHSSAYRQKRRLLSQREQESAVPHAVPSFQMVMEAAGGVPMNGHRNTARWWRLMSWPVGHRSAIGGSQLIRRGSHQSRILPYQTLQAVPEQPLYVREMLTETACSAVKGDARGVHWLAGSAFTDSKSRRVGDVNRQAARPTTHESYVRI